jgi:hypothetical protein
MRLTGQLPTFFDFFVLGFRRWAVARASTTSRTVTMLAAEVPIRLRAGDVHDPQGGGLVDRATMRQNRASSLTCDCASGATDGRFGQFRLTGAAVACSSASL